MVMFFRSGLSALWDGVLVVGEVSLNRALRFRLAGMCISLRSAQIQPLNIVLTCKALGSVSLDMTANF